MNLITISGVPGAGKTTLGKKLGEKHSCLSLELEDYRWEFYKENLEQNMYSFTNNNKKNEKESYRDYYLRNSVYERNISNEEFINWNKAVINYINNIANEIYNELNKINTKKQLDSFINKYKHYINYIPSDIDLSIINTVIISHVFCSNFDISKNASENIILNENLDECVSRFKNREKIIDNSYDSNIRNYLECCFSLINDINKKDIRIKNPGYNFHYRVAGIIMQDNKYLIQQIEGYDYYILPGGHVLLGESSRQAIKREIQEEVQNDIEFEKCNLFCFHENFYNKKEKIEHWVENYYLIQPKKRLNSNNWDIVEDDKGEKKLLHFIWVTKDELKKIDLKPTSIKKIIVEEQFDNISYLIDGER